MLGSNKQSNVVNQYINMQEYAIESKQDGNLLVYGSLILIGHIEIWPRSTPCCYSPVFTTQQPQQGGTGSRIIIIKNLFFLLSFTHSYNREQWTIGKGTAIRLDFRYTHSLSSFLQSTLVIISPYSMWTSYLDNLHYNKYIHFCLTKILYTIHKFIVS